MYFLPVITISILFGLFTPGISDAYIWRCHTPQGDIWTEQPNGNADCQEYDGTYNPSTAAGGRFARCVRAIPISLLPASVLLLCGSARLCRAAFLWV